MLILARKSQEAVVISGTNGYEQVLKVTVLGETRSSFASNGSARHDTD
jgi:hypothetical protein